MPLNTGNEELLDFQGFLRYVERVSNTISKNKLEQLRKVVTRAHEKRFRRRREPKYGSLNKGFTDQELQAFFRAIEINLRVTVNYCLHDAYLSKD